MRFALTIDCDNAAFGETDAEISAEIGRILTTLGQRFSNGSDGPEIRDAGKPLDVNGNAVGRWEFERRD